MFYQLKLKKTKILKKYNLISLLQKELGLSASSCYKFLLKKESIGFLKKKNLLNKEIEILNTPILKEGSLKKQERSFLTICLMDLLNNNPKIFSKEEWKRLIKIRLRRANLKYDSKIDDCSEKELHELSEKLYLKGYKGE